jgi:diguanylate cyclase (GGDEF)-like protein
VLPAQDLESARVGADRMRAAIEELAVPHPGIEAPGVVTVSAGVASFEPDCADDVAKLLKRADAALYEAKEGGRNRVAVGAARPSPRPVR